MKKIIIILCLFFAGIFYVSYAEKGVYQNLEFEILPTGQVTFNQVGNNGLAVTLSQVATQGIIDLINNAGDDGGKTADLIVNNVNNFLNESVKIFAGEKQLSDYGISVGAGEIGHKFTSASVNSNTIGVMCENGWGFEINRVIPSVAGVIPPLISTIPPITNSTTTNSTTTGGSCSSYIANWIPNWSDCIVDTQWNTNGVLSCHQINSWNPVMNTCGIASSTTTTTCDNAGLCTTQISNSCDTTGCSGDMPKPANIEDDIIITLNTHSPHTNYGNAYANNSDGNIITLDISANTHSNKSIIWGTEGDIHGFEEFSPYIPSNKLENTGRALNIDSLGVGRIGTNGSNYSIQIGPITSVTPIDSATGKIIMNIGSSAIIIDNIVLKYKKPFVGRLYVSDDNGLTWTGDTKIGTKQKYKLFSTPYSNEFLDKIEMYGINDFTTNIIPTINELEIQAKELDNSTRNNLSGTIFYARINTSSAANKIDIIPGIAIQSPIISYILDGKNVKYDLSSTEGGEDKTLIQFIGSEFLGVHVIGMIQGGGKSEFTGQKTNISDITPSSIRTSIRKNANILIRSLLDGETVNGIKYSSGDINISGEPSFETLIVNNGNVIIDGNLNLSNKKLGIIVLADGYNVINGYNQKGNIYIKPNVTYLNAVIYADGGFISVNSLGTPYQSDSSTRTYELGKQLLLYGNLLTRNTIGGSILAGGYYKLPNGTDLSNSESNFDLAMQYDLNYIRRGSEGCDKNNDGDCLDVNEYIEPFIIEQNVHAISNPPQGFDVN